MKSGQFPLGGNVTNVILLVTFQTYSMIAFASLCDDIQVISLTFVV